MYYILVKLFLSFIDSFNRKKILFFFKQKNEKKISVFIDVGAHYGETVKIFKKNFQIEKIFVFEPSRENFDKLKKNIKKIDNLKTYNIALGNKKGIVDFRQHFDSESSTLVKINQESKYYKKKNFYLDFFNKKKIKFSNTKVEIDRLDNILKKSEINKIDILKIDTEGYDFHVIEGLGEFINKVKYIYFEHHFHNMLVKKYTLSDIHNFLKKKNFKKVFKIKMFARKTFEYIYCNNSLINK